MIWTLALALAMLLAGAEVANAGPLIPVFALVGQIATAAFSVASIANAVIGTALSLGISVITSKLRKQNEPEITQAPGPQLTLRIAADVPYSFCVGYAPTAGSLVGGWTIGDNSDLVEIIALADHPCDGLEAIYAEGSEKTVTPYDPDPGGVGGYVNEYGNSPAPRVFVRFFDGTQTTADPFAVTHLSAHAERPWTNDHIGWGTTYVRTYLRYNPEVVPGRVEWKWIIRGALLYDPRKDTSVGGSGSHRFDDLDTHEFSANPAVWIYNILRGFRVKDADGNLVHFYGLENTDADDLPLDNWFAAMNECDVDIDGEPQFFGGMEIPVNTPPFDAIKEIIKSCDGRFVPLGGVYKLYIGAPGLPSFSFADGDLRANAPDNYKPIIPQTKRVNYATGKYLSPEDGWTEKIAPPRGEEDWEREDGQRLPGDLSAMVVQSGRQMQQLMQQMLNRARRGRKHVVPLGPAYFGFEPGDVAEWDSAYNSYSDKLFEADAVEVDIALNTTVSLTEVDPDDYEFDTGTDLLPQFTGSVTNNRPPAKIISGFTAGGYLHSGDSGVTRPAIRVFWTPPTDEDIIGVTVQLRRPSEPTETVTFTLQEQETIAAGETIILSGLAPDTEYEVRAKFITASGIGADWSLWIPVTTPHSPEMSDDLEAALLSVDARRDDALQHRLDWLEEQIQILANNNNGSYALLEQRDNFYANAIGLRLGGSEASIVELRQVTIDGENALTVQMTEALSKVNDVSANGLVRFTTSASPDGALAAYDLELRTTAGGVTAYAGFQAALLSTESGSLGRLRFIADLTEFGSLTDGTFTKVFGVSNVNGQQKLAFKSSAVPDDVIESRALANGADRELYKIVGQSDVTRTASQWYNGGDGNTVMTATVPALDEEALLIDFETTVDMASVGENSSNVRRGAFSIYVNDVLIDEEYEIGSDMITTLVGAWNNKAFSMRRAADGMESGDATVRVVFELSVDANPESKTLTMRKPSMLIQRIKKPLVTYIENSPVTTLATYVDSYVGSNGSPAVFGVFNGVSIGAADPNRLLVIFLGWVSASTTTPIVTVDGQVAPLVNDVNAPTTRRLNTYQIPKTTGTTADIVVSLPSDATDCWIGIVNMTVNSVSKLTSNDSYGGADVGMNLPSYADAIGIVAVYTDDGASGVTLSSTTGTVTELVDELNTGGDGRQAIYKIEYSASGGASVIGTGAGATQHNMAGGVWR